MPGPIRDYRDLVCWQQAIELAAACETVANALPRRAWKTAQQLREAAHSVHLNIAEGNGQPTLPGYLKFLGTADSSLNEVQSNLHATARINPRIAGTAEALTISGRVERPLGGLIKALRKKMRDEG